MKRHKFGSALLAAAISLGLSAATFTATNVAIAATPAASFARV